MVYIKTLGNSVKYLTNSEVLQIYFGITEHKALRLISNGYNLSQQNHIITTDLHDMEDLTTLCNSRGRSILRNIYKHNGFTKLLTQKDRRRYYRALRYRILNTLPHIYA